MRMRLLVVAAFALLVLAPLAACGKKGPAGGPTLGSVESDVKKLVPSDAVVLVYAPSLSALDAKVRSLVGSVDPDAAREMSLDALLDDGETPLDVRQSLDRNRPVALAVVPGPDGSPIVTAIVPTKDPSPLVKFVETQSGGQAKPTVQGKYVSVTMGPDPASRSGAIAERVPEGDVAVRVDLARVAQTYAPLLEQFIGQAGAAAGEEGASLQPFFQMTRTLLASAEWLDLAVKIEGARLDVVGEFRAKEGSELAKNPLSSGDGLEKLAGRLPKDYPVSAVFALDPKILADIVEKAMPSAFATLPPESRPDVSTLMRSVREWMALIGNQHAFGMGFGDSGIELVGISAAKDSKTLRAKVSEMVAATSAAMAGTGMAMEALPSETVDGVDVGGWRMTMDLAAMARSRGQEMPPEAAAQAQDAMRNLFGPEGMTFRLAAVDGHLLVVSGGRDLVAKAIASAKKGGSAPPGLRAAIDKAGGKPSVAVHLEGRAFFSGMAALMKKVVPPEQADMVPSIPPGAPAPLIVYASGQGRTYRGGMSVEVGAWADVVKALTQSRRVPGDDR